MGQLGALYGIWLREVKRALIGPAIIAAMAVGFFLVAVYSFRRPRT